MSPHYPIARTGPQASAGESQGMGVAPTLAVGALVVVLFLVGFGAWAAFAPLESAAIAQGVVSVTTKRKTVQHLEGGIVADIPVKEGDAVAAGQILLVLDDTQARTLFTLTESQYHSMAALRERLVAERDGLANIPWPEWLREAVSGEDILVAQERIFVAGAQLLENQTAIYNQQIAQMREEIAGLEQEIKARNQQLGLLDEELKGLSALVEQGYEGKTRLLALERRKAEISGALARNRARIARVEQAVGETRLKIAELGNARMNRVVVELRDTEALIADLRERLAAARHVLMRTHVAAPVSGTVMELRVVTHGGVVGPGEPLMDIVPTGDELVIEARIDPNDIDVVHPGLPAQVRLSAFSRLTTPILTATVLQVSADSLIDERTGTPYYEARVELDPDQPDLRDLKLQPGMPADVIIVTGKRTPLEYLLKPIVTSFGRALREE